MKAKIFQVDAFSDSLFSGNPAAVVPLKSWVSNHLMQNIASENNLSETAFFVEKENGLFELRWFTPQTEVDLCGHATLATAHVLFTHLNFTGSKILFDTHSGRLSVKKEDSTYWLDFPSLPPKPVSSPKLLPEAIGTIPIHTGVNTDLLVLVNSETTVRKMKPEMNILKRLDVRGIIVTAEGDDDEIDFVSRFFAPQVGVPEDPVTGSAHSLLTPFWARRLGKDQLVARQLSERGGTVHCVHLGGRVSIGGKAITYMTGQIFLEE